MEMLNTSIPEGQMMLELEGSGVKAVVLVDTKAHNPGQFGIIKKQIATVEGVLSAHLVLGTDRTTDFVCSVQRPTIEDLSLTVSTIAGFDGVTTTRTLVVLDEHNNPQDTHQPTVPLPKGS